MKLPEGFINAKTIKTQDRLIVSIAGLQKHGKTNFALTAPGPIAFFDLDIGTEGVVGKFASDKEIFVSQYDYRTLKGPDPSAALAAWERMKADFVAMINNKDVATVVIDTATEMWALCRMARLGKLTQVMPHNYGPVNAEFRDLLRLSYMCGKNFILTHTMKAEYVNDKKTGGVERAGFSDIGFLVQCNLLSWRFEGEFGVTVQDCRQAPNVAGMELTGEMCNFDFLKSIVLG